VILRKALAAGGTEWRPLVDEAPMYYGSFQDLDGHVWEIMHMDMGGAQ
jgi:predicted lactoylglutathione lyase